MAILASIRRADPLVNKDAATELGIKANYHGIAMGWFNWPWDFDPVWLVSCNGFEPIDTSEDC